MRLHMTNRRLCALLSSLKVNKANPWNLPHRLANRQLAEVYALPMAQVIVIETLRQSVVDSSWAKK